MLYVFLPETSETDRYPDSTKWTVELGELHILGVGGTQASYAKGQWLSVHRSAGEKGWSRHSA